MVVDKHGSAGQPAERARAVHVYEFAVTAETRGDAGGAERHRGEGEKVEVHGVRTHHGVEEEGSL